ncbi:MAG: pilus assembly protein [Rhodospirillales bacterium]|nr:pilus assembly protein [Rhodospirillales bacterium]
MTLFKRIQADRRGVAATELALTMPVLLILIYGVMELGNALLLDRKVTSAAQSAADLVAQSKEIATADINDVFEAMDRIIAPFASGSATYVVSSVTMNPAGQVVIDWSDARGGAAPVPGDAKNIPLGLVTEGDSVIVAEAAYDFQPVFGTTLISGFTISDVAYLKPRQVPIITRTN